MAFRLTGRDTAQRTLVGTVRGILSKVNDKKKMQENDSRLMHSEKRKGSERFQDYGFSSVPREPTKNKAAEYIGLMMGSSRGHMTVIKVDDRRFRLFGLENGESVQYDDQQQRFHLQRDRILTESHKKLTSQVIQDEQWADERTSRDQSQRQTKPTTVVEQDGENVFVSRQDGQGGVIAKLHVNSTEAWVQYGSDDKKSLWADGDHVHIRFDKFRVWIDKDGIWSTVPILVKQDPHKS